MHLNELYATLIRAGRIPRNSPNDDDVEQRGLAPATVAYVHRVLHRALGHATLWGVVAQNVAASVRPPRVPEREIPVLTQDQIGAILKHIQGRTLRPIVAFLMATGARRGEAVALRWKDIDLDKGTVRIERSLEQTKTGLRFKSPKTRNGRRTIQISPWLISELREHRARQRERRLSLGLGRAPEDSLVFARWDGSTRSPHWVTQKFRQAASELGIDCTLHWLRHTHVSQLIASGLDVLTISRRIGHASPAITLEVYGHLFSNTDARAAEIMEAAFRGTSTD